MMQYPPFVPLGTPGPSMDNNFGDMNRPPPMIDQFANDLIAEKQHIDPSLVNVHSLIDQELQKRFSRQEPEYLEVDIDRPIKLVRKILIPVNRYPNFNFVGKLMGPGGSTLKNMQKNLGVKMNVWGRGSTKDSSREEALLATGESKYAHLKECLHVRVTVVAPPIEAYKKMYETLEEVKKHLNPVFEEEYTHDSSFLKDMNDEISKAQITSLGFNPQKYANQPSFQPRCVEGAIPPIAGNGRGVVGAEMAAYDYGTQPYPAAYGYVDPSFGFDPNYGAVQGDGSPAPMRMMSPVTPTRGKMPTAGAPRGVMRMRPYGPRGPRPAAPSPL